jgi:hypothetical protein
MMFSLFVIVFVLVLVAIVAQAAKGAAQWASDNSQPVSTSESRVVAKREEIRRGASVNNTAGSWTQYFVTFEDPSGNRREFRVPAEEYGLLVEGDRGDLTFQGSRYQGFSRHRSCEND